MDNTERNKLLVAKLHEALEEQDMDSAMEYLQELIDQEKQPAVYMRINAEEHDLLSGLIDGKLVQMLKKSDKEGVSQADKDYFNKYVKLSDKFTN